MFRLLWKHDLVYPLRRYETGSYIIKTARSIFAYALNDSSKFSFPLNLVTDRLNIF